MTLSKQQTLSILRSLTCALCAAVLAWSGLSNAFAAPDSISINFGAENGTPSTSPGYNFGVIPVNGGYWNNLSGKTGTITSLKSNTDAVINVSGSWNSANTWKYGNTSPSTTDNAILYYGYLDDGGTNGTRSSFSLTSPYFSYDIYYYAATDSVGFRYVTINSLNYYGNDTGTVLGTGNWGTPVKAEIGAGNLVEGVNYLKVSSSDSAISITGQNRSGDYRGSFGAVQIVNTADSQSRIISGDFTWSDLGWYNDLTGETEQAYDPSAVGYRLINSTNETVNPTIDLGGSAVAVEKIKKFGVGKLSFTNGVTTIGKTDTVSVFADDYSESVGLSNKVTVVPQGVVKFASGVQVSDATANQDAISGAYVVDGSSLKFARITNGQIVAIAPEYVASPTNGMDLLVSTAITDTQNRTLNSLTTSGKDYINSNAITITSGMVTLQGGNHYIKSLDGAGTITSGYKNSAGEYDLYVCALGNSTNLRIHDLKIIDQPDGKLNLIKTGTNGLTIGTFDNINISSSYTGKTSVLEGKLYICEQIASKDFYVASDAQLYFSNKSFNDTDLKGDFTYTANSLSGYGILGIGSGSGKTTLVLENVANDGSQFATVNSYGKALTLNNSELHAATLNNKSPITLNNSTIVVGTMANTGAVTISFKGESVLDAAISTANALTIDVASGAEATLGKVVSGNGSLVKDGAGKLTLSAKNTYTGGTTVNNGTLELGATGETGTLAPGKTVTVTGENSVLAGHGDVLGYKSKRIGKMTLQNGGTFKNDTAGTHITVNNPIYMNNGIITAEGTGTDGLFSFLFDNAFHVTGGTDNKITAAGFRFRNLSGTSYDSGDSPGLIDVAGGAKLTISSSIDVGSDANMTKAGAGELVLTGKSPYKKNITINGGVLDLTNGAVYTGGYISDANVYVNTGGTLKVNNFGYSEAGNSSLGGLTYSSYGSTNIHFNGGTIQIAESFGEAINRKIELQTNGGTLDLAEDVNLILGAEIHGDGALTKAGAGTLELTYANEYAGGTTISQGEVNLSGAGSLGTGAVAIAQDAVLNLNHDGAARFDNSVSGSGKIYKNGNGVLKIYNPTEGTFASESFVVNAGELDFKGYYKGSLEIGDGATLSPGNSIGTLTIDGTEVDPQMSAFSLDSGATMLMEVGYDENNVWTSDQLIVNGSVNIDPNSTIIITLLEGTALPSGEFTLDLISGTGAADAYDDFLSVVSSLPISKITALI
ncbi:MAG: autotransporter-associated beta strand repeat-containing protein [Thermoguttaceae bacterium]|nr:autotransporter-associated beta strand repeat-containing protein [Thermoguttaceae bacterium]